MDSSSWRTLARRSAPVTAEERSARTGPRRYSPSTRTSRSRRAREAWSPRIPRKSIACSSACATRGAPTAAGGSSMRVWASTTGSTTFAPPSGSPSSTSSTEILARRRSVAARYQTLLADIDGLELPCADDAEHERSWFVYVVALPEGVDRERVIGVLEAHGVQTARYLPCIHLQRVHARPIRLRRRVVPHCRGGKQAHARASVSHAAR